ncbi:MAG: 3-oxoacyl-ACP reductase FabG [Clostridia bacterium]|nr:3-oxoacyl-ACP reductase FabG [Clostridia bacterium]
MKKIAIVTGASRGIGREIAKTLAKEGIHVIANYNKSEQKAEELKKELKRENIDIDIFKADVSKREQAHELVEYTLKKYGKIDILINNAGIAEFKEFTQITDIEWNKMINTNLNSVFIMSQEVLKNMIHNKNGCIINISSIWGLVGSSCEVHYSTAKAGINGMTKALAKELGPSNIRINAIAPGIIDTEMNNDIKEEDVDIIKNDIPLGKIGKTEDIAKCVKWLIEDNFTTGQIISINGGWVII